ncbi:MAG: DUF2312 domain-containing protein [Magnetococcales bacterium]|nr:DUF2312 domain-containing protein [Magnetococcales bacterium]
MNEESRLLWETVQNLWTLEDKKKELEQRIAQVFEKAKGDGFNARALRFVVLMGRASRKKRNKFFRLVRVYEETLATVAGEMEGQNG